MERWRPIQGYSLYEVSDLGRVRRCLKSGHRVLKPLPASNGYRQVCVYAGGVGRRVLVHALVAAAFLGPRPAGANEINHVSGDKADNSLSNLQYMTRAQNRQHAAAHGLCARGQRNGASSLTDVEVALIKARLRAGWPQVALAARCGVPRSLISRIARRESWAWLEPTTEGLIAFLIKGRRTTTSRWRVAGCEDSLPAATAAVSVMVGEWHTLRVWHGEQTIEHPE